MEALESTQAEPPHEQPKWPDDPLLAIWIRPRLTIRNILHIDPKRHVSLLTALAGISIALNLTLSIAEVDTSSIPVVVGFSVVMGYLGGSITFHICSAVLSGVGSLFGGIGTAEEVRSALAWSCIPKICCILLLVPKLALYSALKHSGSGVWMDFQLAGLSIIRFLEVIGVLWTLIIYLICLAETHEFSIMKALLITIIPGLSLIALMFCSIVALYAATPAW